MGASTEGIPNQTEHGQNGVIVAAESEDDAIRAALNLFIELLNSTLEGDSAAEVQLDAYFGKWLSKRNSFQQHLPDSNKNIVMALLVNKGEPSVVLPPKTAEPRRVVSEGTNSNTFVAVLPLKGGVYRFAVLFYQIEAIQLLADGRYDVAFIPGLIFVGEPNLSVR